MEEKSRDANVSGTNVGGPNAGGPNAGGTSLGGRKVEKIIFNFVSIFLTF
jgi:hypothetical protein